jgi:hypothetical protein
MAYYSSVRCGSRNNTQQRFEKEWQDGFADELKVNEGAGVGGWLSLTVGWSECTVLSAAKTFPGGVCRP